MSHYEYATDRLRWLQAHRDLVAGLEFYEEPPVLRFFAGKLRPKTGWTERLAAAFERDFGPEC
jgi:tryptophanase